MHWPFVITIGFELAVLALVVIVLRIRALCTKRNRKYEDFGECGEISTEDFELIPATDGTYFVDLPMASEFVSRELEQPDSPNGYDEERPLTPDVASGGNFNEECVSDLPTVSTQMGPPTTYHAIKPTYASVVAKNLNRHESIAV